MIAVIKGTAVSATARVSGSATGGRRIAGRRARARQEAPATPVPSKYRGARGLDPEIIKEIEKLYGFDKPVHERFLHMMKSYLVFDFGESFFRDRKVVDLVIEKMPVSISLACGRRFWSI